jgi:hypothetical protein
MELFLSLLVSPIIALRRLEKRPCTCASSAGRCPRHG